jgi:hypothetical protein
VVSDRGRNFAEVVGLSALTAGIWLERGVAWALVGLGGMVLVCSFVGRLRENRDDRSATDPERRP